MRRYLNVDFRFCDNPFKIVTALLLLLFTSVLLRAQSSVGGSVEGLWSAETRLGVPVQGEMTLDVRSGKWMASIGGYEEPVTKVGPRLSFSLPGRIGSFKGRLNSVSQSSTRVK